MPDLLAGLVILLPLLAAAGIALGRLAGINRGESGEAPTSRVALGAATASLLALLLLDALLLWGDRPPGQVTLGSWMAVGEFRILISLALDGTGLALATLAGLIFLLTMGFSVRYLHREEGFQRYFAVLSLFMAAMLLIVLAGNLMMMFVGWELAGLASYLLIGYAYDRTTATRNATRALVTNRFGDAGFIVAMALALSGMGSLEWPEMIARAPLLPNLQLGMIVGGLALASLAKSGQFPFAAWLHRALEGPTPSSALFYGAIMVHAGVFLLIRLAPLLAATPVISSLLFLSGLLTVIYGVLVGMVQTDIKSALLFSTQAQVGLMFMACGLGWYELAFWHLLAHAAWRSYLFLSAPAYMHLVQGSALPPPPWIDRLRILYPVAIRRLWLDSLGELLLTRPTQALGRDLQTFDDRVVGRLFTPVEDPQAWLGVPGLLLERLATGCGWIEKHLFDSNEQAWSRRRDLVKRYLALSDALLGTPRYLVLIIILTFIVIL